MSARRFTGWRPERAGWLAGLTGPQLAVLTLACAWPLLGLSQGRVTAVLIGGVFAVVVFVLTVYRPGGRPAGAWVFAYLIWWYADMKSWNVFQSAVAAGQQVSADDPPDLPGTLSRLRFHDGQPVNGIRPCLIEDPAARTWAAVARVEHPGMGLATDDVEALRVAGHARLLAAVAAEGGFVKRIVELSRTTPDDGSAAAKWQADNLAANAPPAALATIAAIAPVAVTSGTRNEYFLVIVVDAVAARRAAKAASNDEVQGYGRVMARELAGLEPTIAEAGFTSCTWLGADGIASALRTGFCPSDGVELGVARLEAEANGESFALPLAAAGPVNAVNTRRYYRHDDAVSASFGVILPTMPMYLEALSSLLVPSVPGERRSLALHFEPVPPSKADRAVSQEIFKREIAAETKRAKKFRITRKERKALAEAEAQEAQIAAGHALTRVAAVITVTVPMDHSIADAAAGLRAAARGRRLLLRPLDLAQDAGFFAAVLPVGLGLESLRGRL